jgi:Flp pilus assembly protein TadB
MDKNRAEKHSRWLLLLSFGMMLTTLGISLIMLSPAGYVFIVVGLVLLLTAVLAAMKEPRHFQD